MQPALLPLTKLHLVTQIFQSPEKVRKSESILFGQKFTTLLERTTLSPDLFGKGKSFVFFYGYQIVEETTGRIAHYYRLSKIY